MSILHLRAAQGNKVEVAQLLAGSCDVNESDSTGERALHLAAEQGHSEVIALLLGHDADVNAVSGRGTTPLQDAARLGRLESVALLLENKASVEAKDNNNMTAFHHAIAHGHFKVALKLLDYGALSQINDANKEGMTPLHLAASKGSLELILLLIEKGAKMDARDLRAETALSLIPLMDRKPVQPPASSSTILADLKTLFVAATGNLPVDPDDENPPGNYFSDISFILEGGRVAAHRNIIALRCPKLRKLVKSDSEIEINQVSVQAFTGVLEWIYTEDCACLHSSDPDAHFLLSLMFAADRFGLKSLKAKCEALVATQINNANFASLWPDIKKNPNSAGELVKVCAHWLVKNWNFFASSRLGQDTSKDDFIMLVKALSIQERVEVAPVAPAVEHTITPNKPPREARKTPVPKAEPRELPASSPSPVTPVASRGGAGGGDTPDAAMDPRNIKAAKLILNVMLKHKHAWPFQVPVDPIALGIPDYRNIIKNPMDLSTVKNKLDQGSYSLMSEFVDDMKLIWTNAMTYNQPGSDIFFMSETLLKLLDSKLRASGYDFSERVNKRPAPVHTPREVETPTRPPPPRPAPQVQQEPEEKRPSPVQPPKEMSFDDKRKLGEKMNMLTNDQLGTVVRIINSSKPNAANDNEGDDIEIDMNDLDIATLRKLEKFVSECLHEEEESSKHHKSSGGPKAKRQKTGRKGSEDEHVNVDDTD